MRITVLSTTVGIALFVAAAIAAESSSDSGRMLLYVDNSLGDDLTVIDLGSFKVVDTIRVGSEPHGLCAPAGGRRLFATIEAEKNLKTIKTTTGEILDTIPLTGRPNECAATPDGRYVGVPIRDADNVDIVDTRLKKVVKVLPSRHRTTASMPETTTICMCPPWGVTKSM